MSAEGLEAIARTGRLPSPPTVALRVIELCEDPDVRLKDLAEVIGQDPALAAKLLKTANSPMFAAASRVVTIERALIMLGIVPSRLLVLTFSLVDHYRKPACAHFDYDRYWCRSALCGALAKDLAIDRLPAMEDYALVIGLLADVGKLVLAECECDRYDTVCLLHAKTGEPIHRLEDEVLDTNHAEVGSYLLTQWNLPLPLTITTRHHHDPAGLSASEEIFRPLIHLIQFSETLADLAMADELTADPAPVAAMAVEYFDMQRRDVVDLIDRTADRAVQIADFLSARETPELDPAALLSRARDLISDMAWLGQDPSSQDKVG
jgi:HD-like signal output (HDOD) protein